MTAAILLDTCARLWLMHGDPMSPESRRAISDAQRSGDGVYVSPITAWEVATLVRKGRYRLIVAPKVWFTRLLDLPGVRLAAMTPDVLIDSAVLPGEPPTDPADRIIAATARHDGLILVTRDGRLIAYGTQGYIRTLAC